MSGRVLRLAVAALLSCVMTAATAEERISTPDSGPLRDLTYGLDVAGSAGGDVAVWFSSGHGVMISGLRSSDQSLLVAGARENRAPQIVSAGDSVDVYWADRGVLHTRRYNSATMAGSETRVIATGVDHPSVARNGAVTAAMVEPYLLGATFTGSVLLLFDESGAETRRVLVWNDAYPYGSKHATVAPHGDGFVSAQWTDAGIFVKRITIDGDLLDTTPIRAGDATSAGAFAAAGELAWIVSRDASAPYPFRVVAIDRTGAVAVSKTVSTPSVSSRTNGLAIFARTDGLVVLAGLDDDVWRFRLGNDGTELEPPRRVVERPGRQSARGILSGESELVFWSEEELRDILVQRDDGEARVLTAGGSSASGLSAAASDERVLVAWRDHLGSAHTYRYSFLDSSGAPLGAPVAFDSGDGFSDDPQVAWSGTEFGILWHANQRTQILLFASDGMPRGAPIVLDSIPPRSLLSGGHGRFVAMSGSGGGVITASVIGTEGAREPVKVTTPIPPPPHASSGDGSPTLLPTQSGFELVYENTFYYDCVGIPCPTETSVYAVALSPDLEPDLASRMLVASDARLVDAAVSEDALGVLVSQTNLDLVTVPLGGGPAARRTFWERTGWEPLLGPVRIEPHPAGFAVAVHGRIATAGWSSFFEVATNGTERWLRVLPGRIGHLRLATSGGNHLAVYSRNDDDDQGSSVYSERWEEGAAGPAAPATPRRVIARRLTPPFVEVSWEYEGPPLLAFSISYGLYDAVTLVSPESRSFVFVPARSQFRVVAINEAGSAPSNTVEPRLDRRRGVRR
ncbi:MAG: hypothetical protein ACSLFQ_12255 [Thermoanaerobaculia bacterium]